MTEKEKEEVRQMAKKADELYDLFEREKLGVKWGEDTERFITLTCIHTATLLRESITLSKLTRWLIVLTIVLAILTSVQVYKLFSP